MKYVILRGLGYLAGGLCMADTRSKVLDAASSSIDSSIQPFTKPRLEQQSKLQLKLIQAQSFKKILSVKTSIADFKKIDLIKSVNENTKILKKSENKTWSITRPDLFTRPIRMNRKFIDSSFKKRKLTPIYETPHLLNRQNQELLSRYENKVYSRSLALIMPKPKPPSHKFSVSLILGGIFVGLVGAVLSCFFGIGIPFLVCSIVAFTGIVGGGILNHLDKMQYKNELANFSSQYKETKQTQLRSLKDRFKKSKCNEKPVVSHKKKEQIVRKTKRSSWCELFFSECLPKRKEAKYNKPNKRPLR